MSCHDDYDDHVGNAIVPTTENNEINTDNADIKSIMSIIKNGKQCNIKYNIVTKLILTSGKE